MPRQTYHLIFKSFVTQSNRSQLLKISSASLNLCLRNLFGIIFKFPQEVYLSFEKKMSKQGFLNSFNLTFFSILEKLIQVIFKPSRFGKILQITTNQSWVVTAKNSKRRASQFCLRTFTFFSKIFKIYYQNSQFHDNNRTQYKCNW